MCLITKQTEPFIADKEIAVYKVLERNNTSPFLYFRYKHGKNKAEKEKEIRYVAPYNFIEGGFLHAYTTRKMASSENPLRWKVRKMYVPVGAEYYISEDGTEICATAMVWKYPWRKIIEFFKKKKD